MRAIVQRVHSAAVTVGGGVAGTIGAGFLLYVGVMQDDGDSDVTYIAQKVLHLRVFEDDSGKMNLDITQAGGAILVVSAFTLLADARKGRRPAFDAAAAPAHAETLFEQVGDRLAAGGVHIARGVFGAQMHVESVNDGPVCILLDSRRRLEIVRPY